jgi:hypothetical protein
MSALTAATGYPRNYGPFGNVRLVAVKFTSVNDTDTYASGLKNIVDAWTSHNADPTTQASVGIAWTVSGSTFTLYPAENGAACILYILTRA